MNTKFSWAEVWVRDEYLLANAYRALHKHKAFRRFCYRYIEAHRLLHTIEYEAYMTNEERKEYDWILLINLN